MHDPGLFIFVKNLHTIDEKRALERRARFWEANRAAELTKDALKAKEDTPKKRGFLWLLGLAYRPLR